MRARRRERGGAPWTTAAEDARSAAAKRGELTRLTNALHVLLADEDLTDAKLRDASERLLPNLADALMANGFGTELPETPA